MDLSIIIVNYKTGPVTAACVKSILRQRLDFKFEIIVVDNASGDESVPFLRSDFPEIKVIANPKNLGLATGVNQGLKQAKGKYCLILNPDMVVFAGALAALKNFMDNNPRVGVSGGQLISPNGEIQDSCYRFYTPLTILYRRTFLGNTRHGRQVVARFLMKDFDHKTTREVDWLMGACLMVRQGALKDVGGMDERFFLYFEDVDWCRRFWEAGWRVVYVPEAKFYHFFQRSSERGIVGVLASFVGRVHLESAAKYFWKYRGRSLPHGIS